jgi:hypothetical protein
MESYGMIMLAPQTYHRPNVMNTMLEEVLQRFAIDADKLAIVGDCASGQAAAQYGIQNLDIFNRIAMINGGAPPVDWDPHGREVEFFLGREIREANGSHRAAHVLRRNGIPLKFFASFRDHGKQIEELHFLGQWLHETWLHPDSGGRTVPRVIADSLPLLTAPAIAAMTDFWIQFRKAPDSIRTTARRAHVRETLVSAGEQRLSSVMADMPALASKYPSVAAALKTSGLTAQQHDAYRAALVNAQLSMIAKAEGEIIVESSVTAKNIAFMDAHPDEMLALAQTGMWMVP